MAKAGSFTLFRQRNNKLVRKPGQDKNLGFRCSISEESKQSLGLGESVKEVAGFVSQASQPDSYLW